MTLGLSTWAPVERAGLGKPRCPVGRVVSRCRDSCPLPPVKGAGCTQSAGLLRITKIIFRQAPCWAQSEQRARWGTIIIVTMIPATRLVKIPPLQLKHSYWMNSRWCSSIFSDVGNRKYVFNPEYGLMLCNVLVDLQED